MKPIKTRDVLLTLFGMMCLAAYILACRPAFSPDGSKVLFPSMDPEAKSFSVALYDRRSQTVETIFTAPPPRDESGKALNENQGAYFFSSQWAPDGKRAIVAWGEGEEQKVLRIVLLPLSTKSPTRLFTLPLKKENFGEESNPLLIPLPVVGKHMFLVCASSIRRLDLETGEIKTESFELNRQAVYAWYGDQIYYLGKFKSSALYEIGVITTDTLVMVPFLTLEETEVGSLSFLAAVSRDGSRIALVSTKSPEPGGAAEIRLLIYRGQALERTILVGPRSEVLLGNPEWSPDGKLVYASYCRRLNGGNAFQCGILEIATVDRRMREVPLLKCPRCEESAISLFQFFQIALSPDGRTAAASSIYFLGDNGIAVEDRALYLVDLEAPDRKVTKVPILSGRLVVPSKEGEKIEE